MITTNNPSDRLDRAQRALADAKAAELKAKFHVLAARAEVADMPARQVSAIRGAHHLGSLLDWEPMVLDGIIAELEGEVTAAENDRLVLKARQS